MSNQNFRLDLYKIRLRVSKTGRLVDRKMLEFNPSLGVLYYHIVLSSKQLFMIKTGIFLILIFAQLIKQQYLRQLEGLSSQIYSIPIRISNADTDGVLHYIQNKETLLPHSQKKKTLYSCSNGYIWCIIISYLLIFYRHFAVILNDFYIIFYFQSIFLLILYFRPDNMFFFLFSIFFSLKLASTRLVV